VPAKKGAVWWQYGRMEGIAEGLWRPEWDKRVTVMESDRGDCASWQSPRSAIIHARYGAAMRLFSALFQSLSAAIERRLQGIRSRRVCVQEEVDQFQQRGKGLADLFGLQFDAGGQTDQAVVGG